MRRRTFAVVLIPALAAALTLTACGKDSGDPNAADKGQSGNTKTVDGVTVSLATDKKPTIAFAKKPFKITKTNASVLKAGTGSTIADGQQVVVNYVGVNGRDGKEFDSSWKTKKPAVFSMQQGALINGFRSGLLGKKVGSRVLIEIPPKDGYGSQGNSQAGIKGTDTLVFVVDLQKAYKPLTKAEGTAVTPPKGSPVVAVDKSKGIPTGVTIPKGNPPKGLVVTPLIKGNGEKLSSDSQANVHLLAVDWRTKKTVDSSWQRGSSYTLPLDQTPIKGITEGLTGQTVGSRVMLVIPPDKGFPEDPAPDVKKSDTIVMVIDILGKA